MCLSREKSFTVYRDFNHPCAQYDASCLANRALPLWNITRRERGDCICTNCASIFNFLPVFKLIVCAQTDICHCGTSLERIVESHPPPIQLQLKLKLQSPNCPRVKTVQLLINKDFQSTRISTPCSPPCRPPCLPPCQKETWFRRNFKQERRYFERGPGLL